MTGRLHIPMTSSWVYSVLLKLALISSILGILHSLRKAWDLDLQSIIYAVEPE